MSDTQESKAAIAVVRRNIEEVQGHGDFDVFEELFAHDFVDHTPQPGITADKPGVRVLYGALRSAFSDFHPEIHWQAADGDLVTTFTIYHGTHEASSWAFRWAVCATPEQHQPPLSTGLPRHQPHVNKPPTTPRCGPARASADLK